MKICKTDIEGAYLISNILFKDKRGVFIKNFNSEIFNKLNLNTNWEEDYFSINKKNVIRGMHFQVPPKDHTKLVQCLRGEILDVIIDLRKKSPTYGVIYSVILNDKNNNSIYIPSGCAHGFLSKKNNTQVYYKVSSCYSTEHDSGILWNSLNFNWNVEKVIISKRDLIHPSFMNFKSPF